MNPGSHTPKIRLAQAALAESGESFYGVSFFALGSQCQLFFEALDPAAAEAFRTAASDWIENFEARYSRFLETSEISRINASAGIDWVKIDKHTELLLDLCAHSFFLTQGAFDATSLPLSLLWDWKRQHAGLPAPEEIAQARALVGWSRVQRRPGGIFLPQKGMQLDFGGVGKEFAVDCLKQLGVGLGIVRILVDLGGDIAVEGDAPEGDGWYVGLEDPSGAESAYCGIRLRGGAAVATSGDYRRCFEFEGRSYSHLLDCRTGWPVNHGTRSATVVAPRCVMAGMLSTAAMALPAREAISMLERTPGVQGCLWSGGRLYETRGFRRATLPQALQSH